MEKLWFIKRIDLFKNLSPNLRLLSLLKRLSEKFGVETIEKSAFVKINIPLTQQNIANMVGSTRETVSSLLNKMRKDGRIITEKRYIYLKKGVDNEN